MPSGRELSSFPYSIDSAAFIQALHSHWHIMDLAWYLICNSYLMASLIMYALSCRFIKKAFTENFSERILYVGSKGSNVKIGFVLLKLVCLSYWIRVKNWPKELGYKIVSFYQTGCHKRFTGNKRHTIPWTVLKHEFFHQCWSTTVLKYSDRELHCYSVVTQQHYWIYNIK